MEHGNALGEFLRARRASVDPSDRGIAVSGHRRVKGLRREELAFLAGISVAYLIRLEQGRDQNPSPQVLDALARALDLDDDATLHLHVLAGSGGSRRRATTRAERVRPALQHMIDRSIGTPAIVLGRRLDVLAANEAARALHPSFCEGVNLAEAVFLDERARALYVDLDRVLADTVASLRSLGGDDLDDPRLVDLVGRLSLESAEFRRLWARHDVRRKGSGVKRFDHPLVGRIELAYESFEVTGAARQMLVAYHAAPGSDDERALELITTTSAAFDLDAPGMAGRRPS
jgi:transcriptional regulator with XRE-family HTH domain